MHRNGFTLIEILVVMALIGLIGALAVPMLRPTKPAQERKQFLARLNALMRIAVQYAQRTNSKIRVVMDVETRRMSLEAESRQKDASHELRFVPVRGAQQPTLAWPYHLSFQNLFIEGYDEMERFSNKGVGKVWFYIVPEGLSQEVIINVLDMKDLQQGKAQPLGLVLNPFSVQFDEYATFQH